MIFGYRKNNYIKCLGDQVLKNATTIAEFSFATYQFDQTDQFGQMAECSWLWGRVPLRPL